MDKQPSRAYWNRIISKRVERLEFLFFSPVLSDQKVSNHTLQSRRVFQVSGKCEREERGDISEDTQADRPDNRGKESEVSGVGRSRYDLRLLKSV